MAVATKNSKKNVSSAKGKAGAYFFWAPEGTALPTDYKTELDTKYLCLGYVSPDGMSHSDEYEVNETKDMNGEIVDSSRSGVTCKLVATLYEFKKDTQALMYGTENVTDEAGLLTVHNKGAEGPHGVLVEELLLKNGRRLRKVCPDAQVVELGELKSVSSDVYAREATFMLYKDDSTGDFWVDFAESTETSVA